MRKLLLILLLFLCSFGQAQIGWGSLSSNQWVSCTDAQGSSIQQIHPLPSTYQWLSKAMAMYYLSIDSTYLSGLTYSQWITKPQLVGIGLNNLIWSFNKTSDYGGTGGAFMKITINGSVILYVDNYSQSGSFSINDGDVVEVEVNMFGYIAYGTTNISISSTGGLAYNVPVTGLDVYSYQSFTYHTGNGIVTINGAISTSLPIFYSASISQAVYKNDCPPGYAGGAVTYNISASKYTSTNSQSEADYFATTDLINNGQVYANTNGSCTLSGATVININCATNQTYFNVPPYDFEIRKNGTSLFTVAGHYSVSYSVAEGDAIRIFISKRSSESGWMLLNIQGSGFIYTDSSPGSIDYTFIYHAIYGVVTINLTKNLHL